jgi:predicted membrane-bound spermidine synthase
VSGLYFKIIASTGVTAGKVDSADHIGACVGSLMAGTILAPIIGIAASSVFVAFLNLACGLMLMVQVRREGSGTAEVGGQSSEVSREK